MTPDEFENALWALIGMVTSSDLDPEHEQYHRKMVSRQREKLVSTYTCLFHDRQMPDPEVSRL